MLQWLSKALNPITTASQLEYPRGHTKGQFYFSSSSTTYPTSCHPQRPHRQKLTFMRMMLCSTRPAFSPCPNQPTSSSNTVDAAENRALSWGGRFGHSKTVQLAFGSRMSKVCQYNPLYIEGQPLIKLAQTHKHLGIILSNAIWWSAQIAAVLLTASQRIRLLCFRARNLQWDLVIGNCICPTFSHAWSMLPQCGTLG